MSITTPLWTSSQIARRQLAESGLTVVATQRRTKGVQIDACLLAWAKQVGRLVKIDRGSPWGNPYAIPADGTRDEVCNRYATSYLPSRPDLLAKIPDLKGKVLVCWCHPARCHGDHLAELANQGQEVQA